MYYNCLNPVGFDERGWSLSRHPANHGKFSRSGLTHSEFDCVNEWVNQQKLYIQSLSLDTKAGLLLLQRYPRAFDEDIDQLAILNDSSSDDTVVFLKELFEIVPSIETIQRYKYLVQSAILNAPVIPVNVYAFLSKPVLPGVGFKVGQGFGVPSFLTGYFVDSLVNLNKDTIKIKLDKGTTLLYMDAGFSSGNRIFLPMGVSLIVDDISSDANQTKQILTVHPDSSNLPLEYGDIPEKLRKSDDTIFYENAVRETMEETGIDISHMTPVTTIDFPLYDQKEYCVSLHTQNEAHVLVPTAHGVAASGSLFICKDDNTVLLFQRSFLGDFGGTWAGVGGAIGEDRAPVYKTLFKFRTYVYSVSKLEKRMWEGKSLPRINYEHLTYQWISLDDLFNQIKDFEIASLNATQKDEVTRFLRAYTAQIPLAATSMDIRKKLLSQGKFSLYIRNPYSRLYELILPGAAYTLWKLYRFLT